MQEQPAAAVLLARLIGGDHDLGRVLLTQLGEVFVPTNAVAVGVDVLTVSIHVPRRGAGRESEGNGGRPARATRTPGIADVPVADDDRSGEARLAGVQLSLGRLKKVARCAADNWDLLRAIEELFVVAHHVGRAVEDGRPALEAAEQVLPQAV